MHGTLQETRRQPSYPNDLKSNGANIQYISSLQYDNCPFIINSPCWNCFLFKDSITYFYHCGHRIQGSVLFFMEKIWALHKFFLQAFG